MCYTWRGDHAAAIEALERYAELDRSSNALDSLGDTYLKAGRDADAERALLAALEIDPLRITTLRKLGHLLMRQGRYREAREKLQAALQQAASGADIATLRQVEASLDLREGRLGAAVDAAELGLRQPDPGPSLDELEWLKGFTELQRGNLAAARVVLTSMEERGAAQGVGTVAYKPLLKFSRHLRAAILAAEGSTAEALEAVEDLRYVEDKFDYWAASFGRSEFAALIGRLYEQLERPALAERLYRAGIDYNDAYAPLHHHLAALLQRGGRAGEAVSSRARFEELWSGADVDARIPLF